MSQFYRNRICQNPDCPRDGEPYDGYGKDYCCLPCARKMTKSVHRDRTRSKLPDPDLVWELRDRNAAHIAHFTELSHTTMRKAMRQDGWLWTRHGLVRAPCEVCGEPFEVDGQTRRRCPECDTATVKRAVNKEPLSEYERELRRRLPGGDRFEAMASLPQTRIKPKGGATQQEILEIHRGFGIGKRWAA